MEILLMMNKRLKDRKPLKIRDKGISYMALPGLRGEHIFPQSQIGRPNQIETLVCNYFGQSLEDVRGKCRRRSLVLPRHIIMFLLRRYTQLSYNDIGILYTGRDHTTVIHAVSAVLNLMETNPGYRKEIVYLESKITKQ